jgi:type IV pilus assembly protein PilM
MDYDLIRQTEKTYVLQVAAIPTEIADQYFAVFDELEITPISFELESQALARAVVPRGDSGTYMLVDYGNSRTGISFIQDGTVIYTTTVPLGGNDQTLKIQQAKNISYEEAEALKKTSGLIVIDGEKSVYDIILPSVSALRGEVYKHFIYWNTHKEEGSVEHKPVNKILLCGGTSNLPGLTDYLATSMQMSVEIANAWVNITNFSRYIPPINKDGSLAYATAIGLALGHL